MTNVVVTPGSNEAQERFNWTFDGRVVVLDNGPVFAASTGFKKYMGLNTFAVVSFDPANKLADKTDITETEEFQLVNNMIPGDGNPVTFYVCVNNNLSASLQPIIKEKDQEDSLNINPVLTTMNIPTIRLNDVDGMQELDLVMLDALHNNINILEHGDERIKNALLIDVQIPLQPTHINQSDFCQVSFWMAQNGFRFCRFHGFNQKTSLPKGLPLEKLITGEMTSGNAIFLPDENRLKTLTENQLLKLSFILHTLYKLEDLAYYVLSLINDDIAKKYLVAEGIVWPVDEDETEFILTEEYSPDIWVV